MSILKLAWLVLLGCFSLGAVAAEPTIGGYELKSTRRITDFEYVYTYSAKVTNSGGPLRNVVASAVSVNSAIKVDDGNLSFGDVPANATQVSLDTFSIRKARTQPFGPTDLVWTVTYTPGAPIWAGFIATPTSGNAPLDVRFTPAPLTDAAIVQYRWDFDGNGSVDITDAVGRTQLYRYNTPGTYPAALTITDSLGRVDKRTVNIVVGNAPPAVVVTATPTNGAAPLAVTFAVSASDGDGIASFEWDFDGNGIYDRTINGTAGSTTFTYTKAGTYAPKLRVTDNRGGSIVVSDPTMTVRVSGPGGPRATLLLSRTSGAAPLAVTLSASVSDPLGQAVQRYEWDAGGDGTFEGSTTVNSFATTYNSAGLFYPRVRVTMADGRIAEDVKSVSVTSTVQLSVTNDTLDTQLSQTSAVRTTLSAATQMSLIVERRGSPGVVRTLVAPTLRPAGNYADLWDGKSDAGQPVPEGVYHAVMFYEVSGRNQRYDLSTSTGNVEFSPPRTPIPSTFEPFNGKPMTTDFTLTRAADVTAFIGSFDVDTRYVTFYTRQPFGRGTQRITWNGESSTGQLLMPAPGDSFLFGILAYTLPDNAIFVRNGVQVGPVSTNTAIYDPTAHTSSGARAVCTVQFSLSLPATAEIEVRDTKNGTAIARFQLPNLPAGNNSLQWNGKTFDGRYAAPGTYRIGVTAIQRNGFRSLSSYTLQRVFY